MNQDFDPDRSNRPRENRDGDSPRRSARSFDRRDDDRANNDRPRSGGPRFNNDRNRDDRPSDDRPRFNRSSDVTRRSDDNSDFQRPRPNRDDLDGSDRNRSNDSRDSKPRFDRDSPNRNTDRFRDERPRFERDSRDRSSGSRFGNDRNTDERAGGSRSSDNKRGYDNDRRSDARRDDTRRDDTRRSDGPRYNNDRRNEQRSDTRRNDDRFGSERRFSERSDDRPRFRRDDDRSKSPDQGRPRFDRDDRRKDTQRGNDRRDDDRRSDAQRGFARRGNDRRNEQRTDTRRNDDRFGSERRFSERPDDRPRFGERTSFSRDDKSGERRSGGVDRNNRTDRSDSNDSRDRQGAGSRGRDRQQGDTFVNESRFSSEQRKESGDRRTGQYTKAPNYDLEQMRQRDMGKRKPASRSAEPEKRVRQSDPDSTRLNRYIANSGVCSRREADELIAQGDISVNGKVVTEMGYKVKPGDTVKYGTKVLNPERFVYVLLNKPKDYITTTDDPEERRTVMELVADAGNFRIYPVGRLDRNTTGLLLLTNDGELADKLTHPSNNIRKIYQVEIDKPITEEHFDAIRAGVELEDGPIKPDGLSIITPDAQVVGIEIHSGRNRLVRRIFEHFGYEVTKLDRTTYAGLNKKDLPRGKWRFLDPKEVVKLKYLN